MPKVLKNDSEFILESLKQNDYISFNQLRGLQDVCDKVVWKKIIIDSEFWILCFSNLRDWFDEDGYTRDIYEFESNISYIPNWVLKSEEIFRSQIDIKIENIKLESYRINRIIFGYAELLYEYFDKKIRLDIDICHYLCRFILINEFISEKEEIDDDLEEEGYYFEDFLEGFYLKIKFIDEKVLSSNEFKSKIQNDIDALGKFYSDVNT